MPALKIIDVTYNDGEIYMNANDVISYLKEEQKEFEERASYSPTNLLKDKLELLAGYAEILAERFKEINK